MNILFLTTHLDTGGITTYLYTITQGLLSRGHKVSIVSSGGNRQNDFSVLGAKLLCLNIRTKSELDPRIYLVLGTLTHFIHENNIDLLHAHTRITQVMGTILNRFTGKPFLSTCHGFFKGRLSRLIFPCWGQAVIAISRPVQEHLEHDFGVRKEKTFLIPNGVNVLEFPLTDEATRRQKRQQLGLDNAEVIGIIARLSEVKGHEVLISAMKDVVKEIPQAKLLIIGEGKTEESLKHLVHQFNLDQHVHFYPIVNKTAEMLSLLDVFVMPSLQEGLGLSVMEAQAAGLPVIASRVGGLPDLIEDGKTGILVEPKDEIGLAQAVIGLLKDKARAKEIGLKAQQFIIRELSADKMVLKTLNVYEQFINKK